MRHPPKKKLSGEATGNCSLKHTSVHFAEAGISGGSNHRRSFFFPHENDLINYNPSGIFFKNTPRLKRGILFSKICKKNDVVFFTKRRLHNGSPKVISKMSARTSPPTEEWLVPMFSGRDGVGVRGVHIPHLSIFAAFWIFESEMGISYHFDWL